MFQKILHRQRNREKGQGGQSMLEFALTLPLLIILLLAMVVAAWVGFSYMSITSAARVGARWMLNYPPHPTQPIDLSYPSVDDEIKAVVFQAMPMLDTSEPATVVTISPSPADRLSGEQISVRIDYMVNLPTITIPYVLSDGEITLSRPFALQVESRMRLE